MTKTNYLSLSAAVLALALGGLLSVIVMALTAPPAKADDTQCMGPLTGTFDNVVVPEGKDLYPL